MTILGDAPGGPPSRSLAEARGPEVDVVRPDEAGYHAPRMSLDPPIEALLAAVLRESAPAVAVDVATDASHFDRALGRFAACLRLRVVLAGPGREDSRYRELLLDTLPAGTPDQLRASTAIVQALAQRLGVPVHSPGPAAPRWIGLQGPSPAREWHFTWQRILWREDGSEEAASGECSVHADCGDRAVADVTRELSRSLAPPYRLMLASRELGPLASGSRLRGYPPQLPPVGTLRGWAVEGLTLADILGRIADVSPLDRMIALESAYYVDLHDLAPVSAFLAGKLSEAALAAAVHPVLERTRGQWSLPGRLLETHAQGRSIGPVLHEYRDKYGLGVIHMIVAMREAFPMSLMAAKSLVDTACSGTRDAELDAELQAVLAALEPRHRPPG